MGGSDPPGKSGEGETPACGLYTSLPILWGESEDIGGFLGGDRQEHWALGPLRAGSSLKVLDSLSDERGALPLAPEDVLVLAQPRPLSPDENVALDDWVNAGGRVLLFADPMLTAHSIFALGDARRPQDIALLSPILGRWGLLLEFDDAQQPGERRVKLAEGVVPVNLPGRFRPAERAGLSARCSFEAGGLLADCKVGEGRVVALADAAFLEDSGEPAEAKDRAAVLRTLLRRASKGTGGEIRGGAGD